MRNSAAAQNLLKTNPFVLMALCFFSQVGWYFGYRVLKRELHPMTEMAARFLNVAIKNPKYLAVVDDLRQMKILDAQTYIGFRIANDSPELGQRMVVLAVFIAALNERFGLGEDDVLDWIREVVIILPNDAQLSARDYFKLNKS